jgi:3-oxoacyl-[acyl-carrier protein] reductase
MGTLEGKVAIITGAANGLGKSHALELARQGARIVVSDLGVSVDGKGRDESAARAVVEEIEKMGGEAVPHFGDVASFSDAQAMIKTAVGRVRRSPHPDLQRGFTRDGVIFNMSEQDFDDVVRVHLKGHFAPQKFAAMYWRERSKATGGQVYARVISTASESFLFGTPGQPELRRRQGRDRLAHDGHREGAAQVRRHRERRDAARPHAACRTAGPFAAMFDARPEGFDNMNPANSSPLFAYLASPAAQNITAQLFIVWGRQVVVMARPAHGDVFDNDSAWDQASLHRHLGPHFEKQRPIVDGYPMPEV